MKEMIPLPIKPLITQTDLSKIDVRIGTINKVEDIPKSKQLVKLIVDFGDHTRKILAGIKQERENPQDVEGKQTLFVVNLKPKMMMGEVSEVCCLILGMQTKLHPS